MKNLLMAFVVLFSSQCPSTATDIAPASNSEAAPTTVTTAAPSVCLSAEEYELYQKIMAHRAEKGLPSIPLSVSLTTVAKRHVIDLQDNRPDQGRCNLHSWSKSDKYDQCCYTSDHSQAACMWDKPRELSAYTGDGYEIAHAASAGATAQSAFEGWKSSPGHHAVMINRDIWKNANWQAIGIGIYKQYAVVWFGKETDPAGSAARCP